MIAHANIQYPMSDCLCSVYCVLCTVYVCVCVPVCVCVRLWARLCLLYSRPAGFTWEPGTLV